ncbi:homoserine kinase [Apilactobacillus kunkeei]|uniref:homoserine kinase n=1 Tax=Apilactobacillus kunkeei TaxID=148814 RepID=UPI0006C52983|nr:homoserine kinase [Apilactobacillus kunkeei]KOY73472.1 Homoserine kinase [Apilactobacillus kunkeei DSM 12361 = ATCC 700308]CAI2570196.1 Homoserine kinase [Apilactobacillus kunkeei]CAI2636962.1 Homoserine kinase [Apilactobacillus kunkeei]
MDKKIIIRVPATSTGIGAGINSIGISFGLYYTVIVEEEMQRWQVNHALGDDVPNDENNIIVQTILKVDPTIKPHQLTVMSDVPIGRGLGSSTTAIVAGIKIANALGELDLSLDDEINIGSKIEGHADGVASALLGDITVSYFNGEMATTVKTQIPEVINALVYLTKDDGSDKAIYKNQVSSVDAVKASSATNVLVASLMSNEWTKATEMMENDAIYTDNIYEVVPELETIRKQAHELGIYGTFLNQSHRCVITFGTESELNQLRDRLNIGKLDGVMRLIKVDHSGATVRGE